MKIQNRDTGEVIFEAVVNSMKELVELAVSRGISLEGAYLRGADLRGADLKGADLEWADLRGADLRGADLRGADLAGAYLAGAYLTGADLRGADLAGADLKGAYLTGADLREADLAGANLTGTNLTGTNLRGAYLEGADLPNFQICPREGGFYAWKKLNTGVVKIYIPEDAQRTSSLIGRKCRASHVKVISGPEGESPTHDIKLTYKKGEIVYADSYDPDIRVECTHGIHFFMTKEEAEEW